MLIHHKVSVRYVCTVLPSPGVPCDVDTPYGLCTLRVHSAA